MTGVPQHQSAVAARLRQTALLLPDGPARVLDIARDFGDRRVSRGDASNPARVAPDVDDRFVSHMLFAVRMQESAASQKHTRRLAAGRRKYPLGTFERRSRADLRDTNAVFQGDIPIDCFASGHKIREYHDRIYLLAGIASAECLLVLVSRLAF
jgi:hypothetical protein